MNLEDPKLRTPQETNVISGLVKENLALKKKLKRFEEAIYRIKNENLKKHEMWQIAYEATL